LNLTLKRASDPRIFLELALMKLFKMESTVNLEDVLNKLDQLQASQSRRLNLGSSSKYSESQSTSSEPLPADNSVMPKEKGDFLSNSSPNEVRTRLTERENMSLPD
jgi:hypothetical protein